MNCLNTNNLPLIISQRVIKTINSMPESERGAITSALGREFILGCDPMTGLSAQQAIAYQLISSSVRRDIVRRQLSELP